MSYVMNVMFSCGVLEEADADIEAPLEGPPRNQGLRKITDAPAYDAWGGTKVPEVDVWAAAFNYIAPQLVLDRISSIQWKEPENVQVFIQDQDADRFDIYEFRGGVLELVNPS